MEGLSPTVRARRLGTFLGALLTVMCATASATLLHTLAGIHVASSDDVILEAVGVLGALFLARLCVICLAATRDVWMSRPELEADLPRSNFISSSRARMGIARWLLVAGALLSPATASAAPAVTNSITAIVPQAPNDDPYLALELAQGGVITQQKPVARPDQVHETGCPPIPEPGWTLPLGSPTLNCRVLGGGGPTPTTPHTHVVQQGETVWGIAASYLPRSAGNAQIAASVNSWIKANPLTLAHPDLIQVGDTLTIPTS